MSEFEEMVNRAKERLPKVAENIIKAYLEDKVQKVTGLLTENHNLKQKVRELEEENKKLSERNAIIEVRIIKAIEANGRFEQHKVRQILKGEGE